MAGSAALKKIVTKKFDALLNSVQPPYARPKIKSPYLWPYELVWTRDAESLSVFVVFSVSEKKAGCATVHLCWSRRNRFPEKSIRPWFWPNFDLSRDGAAEEGSILLSSVAPGFEELVDFNPPGTEAAVQRTLEALRDHGVPFLASLS